MMFYVMVSPCTLGFSSSSISPVELGRTEFCHYGPLFRMLRLCLSDRMRCLSLDDGDGGKD